MLVLVADRHPLFREVLRTLMEVALPSARCLEAASVADVLDVLAAGDGVRLMLVDQALSDSDGLTGLVRLSIAAPDVPVILFSSVESAAVAFHALVCGAAGFISKSLTREEMLQAIAVVLDGSTYPPLVDAKGRRRSESGERVDTLTVRERMVLEALVRGCSNKQIAYELQVSDTTVKVHVSSVLRKLRVHSRTQAVIKTKRIEDDEGGARMTAQNTARAY
ncbi:Transcriptional regulator LuxR family [Paramagnetospirillum magnetotacticum MS-1]|uniref:Transcriptional regulator LuxR family n=1 Tax=Paramagnetospirillum magnetotacticum MS-1 TaxID=272627 RepID=A0A0C2YWK8_PARME|nr:response regulator transcription factor [Paramagnetospirillum magnetotacticum]KIL99508.1 Transcriptional regulator LuxR family [Paramagnetospirillum magnetotacticum MS-1]